MQLIIHANREFKSLKAQIRVLQINSAAYTHNAFLN